MSFTLRAPLIIAAALCLLPQSLHAQTTPGATIAAPLPPDPNTTRLLFAPTARMLPRGGGYLGDYEVVMPFVEYGLTDRISIGGGTPLYFDSSGRPFWITPKIQILNTPKAKVAVGTMHFAEIGDGSGGMAYAVTTLGEPDASVTIGAGAPYVTSGASDDLGPLIVMVGGERRINGRLKFVTENYVASGGALFAGGIRIIADQLTADIALMVPTHSGSRLVAVPLVNFVWKFGQ